MASADGAGRVRIIVYLRVPEGHPGSLEELYHRISKELDGTPGLLGNELLRDLGDAGAFVIMSEWESQQAFKVWDESASHEGNTAALRPLHDPTRDPGFGMYEVVASY